MINTKFSKMQELKFDYNNLLASSHCHYVRLMCRNEEAIRLIEQCSVASKPSLLLQCFTQHQTHKYYLEAYKLLF